MRLHGRNGLVYLSVHNGDAATLLAYLNSWTISFTHDLIETTTFADTQRVYVAGMPDSSGSFTGFMDDATSQTYLAAVDGLPRSMFLYPDSQDMSRYFSGTVLPDLAVSAAVAGSAGITVNWVPAASPGVTRTGVGSGTYGGTYTGIYT